MWLSQKMMAQLYDVEVPTINYHLKKVFADSELEEGSVIRNFRITASDGKTYETKHYNLSAIIAVGYKVNSERAVQFRKWATRVIEEFTIKGFAMDDERLKRGGSVLSDRYFEEQIQRVREIRISERKFYQKITDIYATSVDYDVTAQVTKRFFATVQNELHWAIHGQTAAEVIVGRADSNKEHMGLHTWTDAPHGKIQKFDVVVAKNYLTEHELAQLSRLVNAYLDVAEDMALRKIPMTMQDWEVRLNRFLAATDREGAFGCWQGNGRDRQGARRERVREVPHRAGSTVRERLRPRRGRNQAPRGEDGRAQAPEEEGAQEAMTARKETRAGEIEVTLRAPYMRAPVEFDPSHDILADLAALSRDDDEIDYDGREALEDELVKRFAASPEAKDLDEIHACRGGDLR